MTQTTWLLATGLMGAGDSSMLWDAASAAGLAGLDVAGLVLVTMIECKTLPDLLLLRLALDDDDVDFATDAQGYLVLLTPTANVERAREAWRRTIDGRGVERALRCAAVYCRDCAALRRLRAAVAARAHLFQHAPVFRT